MSHSFVYSHIFIYRTVMNLLYTGGYRARFRQITPLIGSDVRSVCDLCFGDIVIAEWCRSHGVRWAGIDLNPHFCACVRRRGFDVVEGDLLAVDLPRADLFVMAGSLYHFHERLSEVFDVVLARTPRFVISEPVRNLSSHGGAFGRLARRSANPGNRPAPFRYDERTLIDAIREQQGRHDFAFRVVSSDRDMLIAIERRPPAAPVSHVC